MREEIVLGEETIKTVLKNAGLTEKEAVIYILIAKHEPLNGAEIAKLTRKDKAQVFRILKKLQTKGFIEATLEFPTRYTVTPFENILETVVNSKRKEINFIEKTREALVEQLRKKNQTEPSLEKFVVIKGTKRIHAKISKIVEATKHQLSIATTVASLMRADRFDVFDVAFSNPSISQIQYRFLVELSKENLNSIKAFIERTPKTGFSFKATTSDLSLSLFPRMITRDNEEILFFTSIPRIENSRKDEVCLWTNCKSLVQAFNAVFEDLWRNSIDLTDKISEIETGKPAPRTYVISDANEAKKKYEEIVQCAEEEIVFMTSSKNLREHLKTHSRLADWTKKGVSVRIMAPIVSDNLEVATKISKICAVKHVPISYPEATIVDGKHYFQFKTLPASKEKHSSALKFVNTFYTNDIEYVEKMKTMFDEVWKNSYAPSPITLKAILEKSREPRELSERKPSYLKQVSGLSFKDREQKETTTEKDVLNKIINAETFPRKNKPDSPMRMHGSTANAVIHPPPSFNLPDMVITVLHIEKHSSFGEEDAMLIYLWLETPTGPAYVPVAYVGDNSKVQTLWKALMRGTPAGQNIQLVKKDELQVRIHGNTLFVGWTRQIPLLPPKHVLPPACLLIEGYGELKTDSFTLVFPSGYKSDVERNGCEAFVTFFHPSSKYSGPGTDGYFARDYVATTYSPSEK
jgi:sugar-specific transcriptional regulator TrmB